MQFGNVGTDGRTVALQKLATLSLGADAALPQCCVAQLVPDRHPGRLQTAEKLDPGQDRCVVVPLARLVAVSIGQQPDPLIVTDRMCCQSRAFRQFTNFHEHPSRSTTQRKLRVRVRSRSRGNSSQFIFGRGQGGGRLCRYAKLLLIICPRERTSARHNPEIGIMTELIECGPMPIDRFEISLGRQHLDEIAVVSPTSAARRRSSFGVKRSA